MKTLQLCAQRDKTGRRRAWLAVVLAGTAGCALGKQTNPVGLEKRWDELTTDERSTFMVAVFEPRMHKAFVGFDAERFADFGCPTCHGAGADDGTYAMPNPALPHLNAKGFYREHRKAHPEISGFMWKGVAKPGAKLLGKTLGPSAEFECWSCHVVAH